MFTIEKPLVAQYVQNRIIICKENVHNTKIIENSLELPLESEMHIKDNPVIALKPEIETKVRDSANHRFHLTKRQFEA